MNLVSHIDTACSFKLHTRLPATSRARTRRSHRGPSKIDSTLVQQIPLTLSRRDPTVTLIYCIHLQPTRPYPRPNAARKTPVDFPLDGPDRLCNEPVELLGTHILEPLASLLPVPALPIQIDGTKEATPSLVLLAPRQQLVAAVRCDPHESTLLAVVHGLVVLHVARYECVEGMIATSRDMLPGVERRPSLSDEDVAREHCLTWRILHELQRTGGSSGRATDLHTS